jgi:hypothetical protein
MATNEPAIEHPTDAHGRKLVWTFGANDHIEELQADKIKDFKPSGSFFNDFQCLSAKCGIAMHPGFAPPRKQTSGGKPSTQATPENASQNPASNLSLHAILVGRAAMLIFRQVIPTSLHIEVLRLTSCCLDVECLGLLRAGLTEACSVAVLQLDWNPVEVPVDAVAVKTAFEAGQMQEIDELEKKRERQQAERTLRTFGEILASRFGDIASAMKALRLSAIKDRMHHEATAGIEPFPLALWIDAFHDVLGKGTAEAERIFSILDDPRYDGGDGFVAFSCLEDALQNLPALEQEEEANDPISKSFAAFVDAGSPLDVVSFRHCGLSRLECLSISRAFGQSQHLRALNLWGNDICDHGVAALAEALEVYYGLQFLGLGHNMVTHVGLESLCVPLGFSRIEDKTQADQVQKDIKERMKERDKRMKNPPVAKKDIHGNDRYIPEFPMSTCESQTDESGEYWLWGRNLTLKTLNLEHNPITDATAVMRLQPWGVGTMLLRGVPCAAELSQLFAEVEAKRTADTETAEEDPTEDKKRDSQGGQSPLGPGWTFMFQ